MSNLIHDGIGYISNRGRSKYWGVTFETYGLQSRWIVMACVDGQTIRVAVPKPDNLQEHQAAEIAADIRDNFKIWFDGELDEVELSDCSVFELTYTVKTKDYRSINLTFVNEWDEADGLDDLDEWCEEGVRRDAATNSDEQDERKILASVLYLIDSGGVSEQFIDTLKKHLEIY